jgi:hypothetical protein
MTRRTHGSALELTANLERVYAEQLGEDLACELLQDQAFRTEFLALARTAAHEAVAALRTRWPLQVDDQLERLTRHVDRFVEALEPQEEHGIDTLADLTDTECPATLKAHCWHEPGPTHHGSVPVGVVLTKMVPEAVCCWCGQRAATGA